MKKGRRLCLADVHGNYKALLQVLNKCNFDYKNDTLVCLGDIVDGYPDSKEVIDRLMMVEKLELVIGNHDMFFLDWLQIGDTKRLWLQQGGYATVKSFGIESPLSGVIPNIDNKYKEFFKKAEPYKIIDNKLFVHGGYAWNRPIEKQDKHDLMWNRDLFYDALSNDNHMYIYGIYDEIYIGHTTTQEFSLEPVNKHNVFMLDQGAGYCGCLSIIDIDTKEYWISEPGNVLYEGYAHR